MPRPNWLLRGVAYLQRTWARSKMWVWIIFFTVIIMIIGLYRCWKTWELKIFRKFIRDKVITTFHNQRQREDDDRFAVLILTNSTSLFQLSWMSFKRCNSSNSLIRWLLQLETLFDSSYPSYPVRGQLDYYIVARAESTGWLSEKHPESILLERLNELKLAYQTHYGEKAKTILLYSWKLPCARCVDEINQAFSTDRSDSRVIIVYTDGSHSRVNGLRDTVIEVPYNKLPSIIAKRQCCIQ